MYSYIKGILAEADPGLIVVENNGIGYNIHIPTRLYEELPMIGSDVKIYTYLNVREDAFNLFGFSSRDELEIFKLLINVSGIGPKGGLAILSIMSPNDIRFAVISGDAKAISKAQGVGAKTAQKVIIELKDKVDLEDALDSINDGFEAAQPVKLNNVIKKEACEALTALGYSSSEAAKAVSAVELTDDMDVEDVLKAALKHMAFL